MKPRANPSTPARSFERELARCIPALRARALKLCLDRDAAQDLVQDTLLRALRFKSSFEPGTNLAGWAQTILSSVFLTRCRARARRRRAMQALRLDPTSWLQPATPPHAEALSPPVQRAVAALPPKFSDALRLVDLQELSYREAASELGVPVGTIMSRLFRARRQLGHALADPPVARAA